MYTLNDNRVLNEWFYLTLLYTHPSRSDPTLRGIVTLFGNFVKLEGVFASIEFQNY